jgi:HSP20 family protein
MVFHRRQKGFWTRHRPQGVSIAREFTGRRLDRRPALAPASERTRSTTSAAALQRLAGKVFIRLGARGGIGKSNLPARWMWSEACEILARAERLHREFFRPASSAARLPAWEPPVDVLETERAVFVLVALPAVNPDRVEASIDGGDLVFSGNRVFPVEMRTAVIHRLEHPQGRFEPAERRG